jgi:hypothetical protein
MDPDLSISGALNISQYERRDKQLCSNNEQHCVNLIHLIASARQAITAVSAFIHVKKKDLL